MDDLQHLAGAWSGVLYVEEIRSYLPDELLELFIPVADDRGCLPCRMNGEEWDGHLDETASLLHLVLRAKDGSSGSDRMQLRLSHKGRRLRGVYYLEQIPERTARVEFIRLPYGEASK